MSLNLVPRQLRFNVNGISFAAQEWGRKGDLPVLALHGWLDNSASFYALAPRMESLHIVALDLAGHGQSEHRPGQSAYNLWDDVSDIFAVADCLGWHNFALLGHSRGGIISTLAAGTFPERILALALIEGFIPEAAAAQDAPRQLANAIKGLSLQRRKPLSTYPNIELAIKARARGMFPLGISAARALTERGLKSQGEGYCWSSDPLLLAPSMVKLSREQIHAFVNCITAPVKLLLAEGGLPQIYPSYLEKIRLFANIDTVLLAGGHHLHMEAEVDQVAECLVSFFAALTLPS